MGVACVDRTQPLVRGFKDGHGVGVGSGDEEVMHASGRFLKLTTRDERPRTGSIFLSALKSSCMKSNKSTCPAWRPCRPISAHTGQPRAAFKQRCLGSLCDRELSECLSCISRTATTKGSVRKKKLGASARCKSSSIARGKRCTQGVLQDLHRRPNIIRSREVGTPARHILGKSNWPLGCRKASQYRNGSLFAKVFAVLR